MGGRRLRQDPVRRRGDGFAFRAQIANADLVWTPTVGVFTGVLDLESQPNAHHAVDIAQGYILYKPVPTSETHVSARVGLFYPPVSMEHEGYGGGPWSVTNTITPSAINAWIGQEGKVVGGEGAVSTKLGGDRSARRWACRLRRHRRTFLALRGWSLDDVTGAAFGRLPLPPLNSFLVHRQTPFTEPVLELDSRVGYYARLDWKTQGPFAVNLIYYDNRGDKVSKDAKLQWAWATRFWNLGASYDIDDHTWLIAQAMTGRTLMGFPHGHSVWVDVDFASAFLLAAHSFGRSTVSGRIDWFSTSNEPAAANQDYGEKGYALTADYKFRLSQHVTLLAEVLHVQSDRPRRAK